MQESGWVGASRIDNIEARFLLNRTDELIQENVPMKKRLVSAILAVATLFAMTAVTPDSASACGGLLGSGSHNEDCGD